MLVVSPPSRGGAEVGSWGSNLRLMVAIVVGVVVAIFVIINVLVVVGCAAAAEGDGMTSALG